MEFKSQICTTREQSERLLALGLKKETADMEIEICKWDKTISSYVSKGYWEKEISDALIELIPAWSLHRLQMMYGDNYSFFSLTNAYGELIDAIAIDIEKGAFNKDYLEEKK